MFGFIKKCFFTAVMFSCNVLKVILLKCVSMNNQQFRISYEMLKVMNLNSIFTVLK